MNPPTTLNLAGKELRKSYPSYNSNFGNRTYNIERGAKDNQLELLKKFGAANILGQHPETAEWIVEFEGELDNFCFFGNKEDAIAFVDFHNWTHVSKKDKKIGYVGGVPRVNPPAAIRDEESRERQKDIEKHRSFTDPDENWSGLR